MILLMTVAKSHKVSYIYIYITVIITLKTKFMNFLRRPLSMDLPIS